MHVLYGCQCVCSVTAQASHCHIRPVVDCVTSSLSYFWYYIAVTVFQSVVITLILVLHLQVFLSCFVFPSTQHHMCYACVTEVILGTRLFRSIIIVQQLESQSEFGI